MCSISGINFRSEKVIKKMNESQQHRAPDESGYILKENFSFGMGRLKIIDLVSSNLCPFQEDGYILCYNGEIYNYLELRKELKTKWKFKTNSDTEVLLKAYREWGDKMFSKLNGMFAFCIFDPKKNKIILARDIAGEKPLYYYKNGRKFAFSSELKALHKVFDLKLKKGNNFFKNFQHCLNMTLWKDVFQVPAANFLVYDLKSNKIKIKEYWELKKRKINIRTINEEFEYLLKESIKIRTRSDVPLGIYKSDGIDSNVLAKLNKFKYSFYFNDNGNWKKDFFKKIKKVAYHLDLPVGSLSSYPLFKLAERASKKVKVIMSGEGADEIFGGYVRYLPIARQWELEKKFQSYKYLFKKFYSSYLESFSKITCRSDDYEFVRSKIKNYFEMFDDPINAMGFADFKLIMPSLLQMGDRMSSSFGVENRCPYLDKSLIEFGFNLPAEYKIKNLEQKILLKNLARKLKLNHLLKVEKKGLTIKFNSWFSRNDWNRDYYFTLLKKEWKKSYQ